MISPGLQLHLRNLLIRWRTPHSPRFRHYQNVPHSARGRPSHKFQRIVWRDSKTSAIKDYKLLTVTLVHLQRLTSSGVRSMQQIAYVEGVKYSLAAEKDLKNYSMDVLITGCESKEKRMLSLIK